MAARKKPTTKKASGTRKRAPSDYKGKALPGRAQRGREWDPAQPQAMAAALPEVKEPQPYTSRYPISNEAFQALKEAAPKAKLAKSTAARSKDASKKKDEMSARAMAPAPLEAGLEPVAAPIGSTNFVGITATGWIPADCTMAVGPQHVLLSVNSSMAIYSKTGGPAVFQRTLTQWFSNVIQGMTIFDPKALYDQHAGRWVLLAVAVRSNPKGSLHLIGSARHMAKLPIQRHAGRFHCEQQLGGLSCFRSR